MGRDWLGYSLVLVGVMVGLGVLVILQPGPETYLVQISDSMYSADELAHEQAKELQYFFRDTLIMSDEISIDQEKHYKIELKDGMSMSDEINIVHNVPES